MSEAFDVVIVGARCAGAPLANELASRGMRVCVLDRARFPSEVPSTHAIQPVGVTRLDQLGVLDEVLATGAPPFERVTVRFDDVSLDADLAAMHQRRQLPMCVRRSTLDPLLAAAAQKAGADVRLETLVTGLLCDEGIVRGVRTESGAISAPVVVGADGPNSFVARLVGAREYHVTRASRFFLWAYFEGARDTGGHANLIRTSEVLCLGMPTDGGLYLAAIAPRFDRKDEYLSDLERTFDETVSQIDELTGILGSARRVGRIRVMLRWHGYFRESAGHGWVLVGDAGHFKDPAPAQGISDAFRQGERLADAIELGLGSGALDRELARWWRWRDEDAWGMYWFAQELGGGASLIARDALRGLATEREGAETFMRILNHDVDPWSVFSPSRALRSFARTATRRPRLIPELLSELRSLAIDRLRRDRLRRRPRFEDRGSEATEWVA